MNELALFAGAGGGVLASSLLLGHRIVAAVEIDPYCREVLLRRQRDGVLPVFPIWDDIRTFDGTAWRGIVDLVSAGFPCQPFSQALSNRKRVESDSRNMWPETIRVIREVGPRRCLLENVPGLVPTQYFGTILGDILEGGYCVQWDCIPASAVGANHQRDRLWLVADSERVCRSRRFRSRQAQGGGPSGELTRRGWWTTEPTLGRVANGVAHRMDRLRAIGNGQVPAVASAAWRLLAGEED